MMQEVKETHPLVSNIDFFFKKVKSNHTIHILNIKKTSIKY